MKGSSLVIAVIASLCAASLQASDDVLIIERSAARSGVGPQFVEKAEFAIIAQRFSAGTTGPIKTQPQKGRKI